MRERAETMKDMLYVAGLAMGEKNMQHPEKTEIENNPHYVNFESANPVKALIDMPAAKRGHGFIRENADGTIDIVAS